MAEIKSIKIVPFTLMSSSISAILALIGAIILTLALGVIAAFLPPQLAPLASLLAGLGLAAIIAYPILTFLIGLSAVFLSILLYNLLAPKVGGVQLTMDGSNVESIPIVPFALILSIIMAIWTFIMGLLLTTILAPVTGLVMGLIPLATNGTATGAAVGSMVAFGAIFFIILLPILVFIFGFIGHALFAAFYNFIAAKASKIQLNFEALPENWNKLTEIPIIPAALALAIVSAIFGLILGILDFASGLGVMALLVDFIGNFIYTFIVVAIGAWLYNVLAPKIGAVQLELE